MDTLDSVHLGQGKEPSFCSSYAKRQHLAEPILEIRKSTKPKCVGDSLTLGLRNPAQASQELDKHSVSPSGRIARFPEIRLCQLLGYHLQVVKLMARGGTIPTKRNQDTQVRFCLAPPEFLVRIHFFPRGSLFACSNDQLGGSGSNDCRIRSHWPGVTSRTSNVCSFSIPRSTPKSIGSRASSLLSATSSLISISRISRSGAFVGR
jgi:hypothetical protein